MDLVTALAANQHRVSLWMGAVCEHQERNEDRRGKEQANTDLIIVGRRKEMSFLVD